MVQGIQRTRERRRLLLQTLSSLAIYSSPLPRISQTRRPCKDQMAKRTSRKSLSPSERLYHVLYTSNVHICVRLVDMRMLLPQCGQQPILQPVYQPSPICSIPIVIRPGRPTWSSIITHVDQPASDVFARPALEPARALRFRWWCWRSK